MAEGTLSHLNYGQVGTATYDIDTRDWTFARQFTPTTLKQIGIREQPSIFVDAVLAPVQFPNTALSTHLTDAKNNVQSLVRDNPQLVGAEDLLPELATTSAAIISASSTYDPLVGSLYSTGSITFAARSEISDNPRRVVATVTGEAGNVLRLGFLYKEHLGWDRELVDLQDLPRERDHGVWIRANTLRNTECGYWSEGAAPIQQVCFSQSEDKSNLLAVRLLTRTVIFRPFYSRRPRPAEQSPYHKLPPSLLDARPILSLENDQSGGSPHADVTFNPDFQLQFAVVDQSQTWSVWDIEHGRKGNDYKLSLLVQGHITPPEDADLTGEDGWARILWVGDVNTMFVCNRRHASIVGIKGDSFEYLPCPALIANRTGDWILDVKRHPSLRGRFFVLTSTELVLMAVTTSSEATDTNVGPMGARVLLSWRHYRGTEDFTLCMSVHMLDEDGMYFDWVLQPSTDRTTECCVILRSRLNNLTQTYTYTHESSNSDALVSSAIPTLLHLITGVASNTLEVATEPCRFQGDTDSGGPGRLGQIYHARKLRFMKVFMLQSDLSVYETVLYTAPLADGGSEHEAVEDITWTKTYLPRKNVLVAEGDEMRNFIELEGIEAINKPISSLVSQAPKAEEGQNKASARRVVDHRLLYDALTRKHHGSVTANIDIRTVTARLKQSLVAPASCPEPPPGTM
jgi:RNA polymerase I-specific transcription initiation factor RRN6